MAEFFIPFHNFTVATFEISPGYNTVVSKYPKHMKNALLNSKRGDRNARCTRKTPLLKCWKWFRFLQDLKHAIKWNLCSAWKGKSPKMCINLVKKSVSREERFFSRKKEKTSLSFQRLQGGWKLWVMSLVLTRVTEQMEDVKAELSKKLEQREVAGMQWEGRATLNMEIY